MGYYLRRFVEAITYPIRALLYSPGRLFSPVGRLVGVSLPARVAILVAIFLVICVVTAFVGFYFTENRASWNYWINPVRIITITVLVVVIPILVYRVLKLWLQGEESLFPDIDYAWKAGLAELKRHQLGLWEIPVFLVLGSAGDELEKALFDASRLSLRVREFPQGPAALHWYANPDGIYLVCTDVGCLSRLATLASEVTAQEVAAPVPAPPRTPGGGIRGTVAVGGELDTSGAAPPSVPLPNAASGPLADRGGDIRGTMVVSGGMDAGDLAPAMEKKPVRLAHAEAAEQEQRLRYVGKLLRRTRQPLCPINGILTLLPYGLIQRGPREGIELQRAVDLDLQTAHRALQLRCPVTAVVTGMEQEAGFRELVRRIGRDRVASQRFGKGFTLWSPPLPERLEALCAHACGAFEDWVYALFRERGSLAKPGNTKLYHLICQVRRNVRKRLGNVLVAGYGHDPDRAQRGEPLLFSGCYFAATGPSDDRQAFVKGVFDKLPDQQEELEWTQTALVEDEKYQRLALAGMAIDLALLLCLVGMFVYHWVK